MAGEFASVKGRHIWAVSPPLRGPWPRDDKVPTFPARPIGVRARDLQLQRQFLRLERIGGCRPVQRGAWPVIPAVLCSSDQRTIFGPL